MTPLRLLLFILFVISEWAVLRIRTSYASYCTMHIQLLEFSRRTQASILEFRKYLYRELWHLYSSDMMNMQLLKMALSLLEHTWMNTHKDPVHAFDLTLWTLNHKEKIFQKKIYIYILMKTIFFLNCILRWTSIF